MCFGFNALRILALDTAPGCQRGSCSEVICLLGDGGTQKVKRYVQGPQVNYCDGEAPLEIDTLESRAGNFGCLTYLVQMMKNLLLQDSFVLKESCWPALPAELSVPTLKEQPDPPGRSSFLQLKS